MLLPTYFEGICTEVGALLKSEQYLCAVSVLQYGYVQDTSLKIEHRCLITFVKIHFYRKLSVTNY